MLEKTIATSGADEKTPSIPQYFSWINNTDEGGCEEQTLINLEYFKWLHDEYGMEISIYALDEGNIDGPWGRHENLYTSKKTLGQYPEGLGKCAAKAGEFGCRLGIWAGADGFGDTPEEEAERVSMFLRICRDYNIREIKFDTVCDWLRTEKRGTFKRMVDECRKICPDLIVLNHRHDLGEAAICSTTFLLDGLETYVDVHSYNTVSGPHHRMGELTRGLVPGMIRLTEDHGVCISSSIDAFEDGLILQAFARCLILAPEIYGNPWLMRDDEHKKLARIYNIHAKYRDILVNGFALPEATYTKNSVSRGDENTRLLTFSNPKWTAGKVSLGINGEIGLWGKTGDEFIIKCLHPYEELLGCAEWNSRFEIELEPARAGLFLVQRKELFLKDGFALSGCRYETVYGPGAVPARLDIYKADGRITSVGNRDIRADLSGDSTTRRPVFLGKLEECGMPENARQLYESTCFSSTNDAFEAQSRRRAGDTLIPQVKAAREAFFRQANYRARGCESSFMFDGDPDTFFDGQSVSYRTRLEGGCLRVDIGGIFEAGDVEIEFVSFDSEKEHTDRGDFHKEIAIPDIEPKGDFSEDLLNWTSAPRRDIETVRRLDAPVTVYVYDLVEYYPARIIKVTYHIGGRMRYFRLPRPMDRIVSFRVFDTSRREIAMPCPKATNLFAPWRDGMFSRAKKTGITIPADMTDDMFIAVANNGYHGTEGVYCAMEADGIPVGSCDRAPAHNVNNWEYITHPGESGYTYFFRPSPDMRGKTATVYALFRNSCDVTTEAWLCDSITKSPIGTVELP